MITACFTRLFLPRDHVIYEPRAQSERSPKASGPQRSARNYDPPPPAFVIPANAGIQWTGGPPPLEVGEPMIGTQNMIAFRNQEFAAPASPAYRRSFPTRRIPFPTTRERA